VAFIDSDFTVQGLVRPPAKETANLIKKETFGARFGNRLLLGFAFRNNNGKM